MRASCIYHFPDINNFFNNIFSFIKLFFLNIYVIKKINLWRNMLLKKIIYMREMTNAWCTHLILLLYYIITSFPYRKLKH